MNTEQKQEVDTESVKEAARQATETGESIQTEVRDITVKALSQQSLDREQIKQVIHAVMEGVGIGAKAKGGQVKEALSESMAGLDEALEMSAQASKLALEEASGHLKEFGKQDLKQATDDLLALEEMYLDTLKRVAKGSDEIIGSTLNDLIQHARNSGTAVGKRSREIVSTLNHELEHTLSESVSAGTDAAVKVASQLTHAAAGFLEGIAQTLDSKGKNTTSDKQE